jgi:hypothetical protein
MIDGSGELAVGIDRTTHQLASQTCYGHRCAAQPDELQLTRFAEFGILYRDRRTAAIAYNLNISGMLLALEI